MIEIQITPFNQDYLMHRLLVLVLLTSPAFAKIDFATEIQPILSNNCFACHGPDEDSVKGGLRLDKLDLALKGGDSGDAIVPGKPENSLIITRLSLSHDDDDHMPPLDKKDPLTTSQKELLQKWIEEGARWGQHWAFIPPKRPKAPKIKDTVWIKNDIDRFILARLEAEGLRPSKPANPRTLLRRLHLDVTGLPPSLAALRDFQLSNLGSQIESLLASPHYGEKWGREWLDVARYADSSGYEKDLPREMHFYRDWVVKSINNDMGYDDFIIKQIAGDLLPNSTQDDRIATGYLRNSMTNEEGGAKPEQFRVEGIFDRVDAVGKGILGITTQCAQCHTHKYDPLTHDEYFGIFAYLNSIRETSIPAYSAEEETRINHIKKGITTIENRLKAENSDWQELYETWQDSILTPPLTAWTIQKIAQYGDDGQKYQNLADDSLINQGYAATMMTAPFQHESSTIETIHSVRLELLNDPYLSLNGPGRSMAGTAALSEYLLHVNGKSVKFKSAKASVNPLEAKIDSRRYPLNAQRSSDDRTTGGAQFAIDGNNKTAWTTDQGPGRSNDPQVIVMELERPITKAGNHDLKTFLVQRHGGFNSDDNQNFNIGRFRLSFSSQSPTELDTLPPLVRGAILLKKRTLEQEALVFRYWRSTASQFSAYNEQIEKLWKQHPTPAVALVAKAIEKPRITRLFERGEQTKPQHEIKPFTPAFLNPLPNGDPASRLTFAKWLVADDSPTAARTLVNRIWQSYFGIGLLETPEDLGLQSPRPSHPKLLDWLAVELMENDWSMKHIHRLILGSATYQQDSAHISFLKEKDPNNRLLARGARIRVPAEILRDIQLSTSGLINLELGGRCVFPPAPEFLFQKPVSYGPKTWNVESDSQRYRRALYTFRFRSVPYPMLAVFDGTSGDAACVRRTTSTTPLQALTTLNEPMSVEAAIALGDRILRTSISDAFEHCTSRPPKVAELRVLNKLFEIQKTAFTRESAQKLITTYKPLTLDLTIHEPVQLAAATSVAQTLLNLDETMTKN